MQESISHLEKPAARKQISISHRRDESAPAQQGLSPLEAVFTLIFGLTSLPGRYLHQYRNQFHIKRTQPHERRF